MENNDYQLYFIFGKINFKFSLKLIIKLKTIILKICQNNIKYSFYTQG